MMSNVRKVAQVSLSSARTCLVKRNYGRAFANFLLFLKLAPQRNEEVRSEFSVAMREWSESLEREGRIDELFKCYDQACEMFPNHDAVLNNIGAQLFRLGYAEEAAAYIRRALIINPDYLAARENLENICSHLVERWHFSMLNDCSRNKAYREAIRRAVIKGYSTVLDIGAGTGILSLIACDVGASKVYACEKSHAMYEVARDVLETNCADERVLLFHRSSTELLVPDDLSEKVSLVVTETFDAGLFGEHIVSTMVHAWKNLLCRSQSMMGSVVPCAATMYVCGIESEALRKQNRLVYPMFQNLDLSSVDITCTTGQIAEEPYTTENLAWLRGGYKMLTNVTELLRVNFCNPHELDILELGKDWTANLMVKQHGRLDALAVWFDLHLDECVTITTAPDTENCWEQAVYPVLSVHRDRDKGQEVCFLNKQERIQVTFHFEHDCLRLSSCTIGQDKHIPSIHPLKTDEREVDSGLKDAECSNPFTNDTVDKCPTSVLPLRKRKIRNDYLSSEIGHQSGKVYGDYPKSENQHQNKSLEDINGFLSDQIQPNAVAMATDEYLLQQCGNLTIDNGASACAVSQLVMEDASNRGGDSAVRTETRSSTVAQLDDFSSPSSSNILEEFPVLGQSFPVNRLDSDVKDLSELSATKVHVMDQSHKQLVEYFNDSDDELETLQAPSHTEIHNNDFNMNSAAPNTLDTASRNSQLNNEDCIFQEAECVEEVRITCQNETKHFDAAEAEVKLNIDVPLDNLEIINDEQYYESVTTMQTCDTEGNKYQNDIASKELMLKSKASSCFKRPKNKYICLTEPSDIMYLNDIHLNRSYFQVLESITKRQNSISPLSLMYNTTRLCFLALQAKHLALDPITMVTSEDHHGTIETVMAANNLRPGDITLLDITDADEDDRKYDVIIFDLVEPCGALRQQVLEDIALLRVTALSEHGVIVPGVVTVQGLFIESTELERISHVIGSHLTLGYSIADFINVFQLRNHVDIDLETLPHEKMTEVFQMFQLDLNHKDSLESLQQTNQVSLKVIESGNIHALVYWFELELVDGIKVSTLDARSHWRQAGIMMKDEVSVESGQNLVAIVTLQNSCLDVEVKLSQPIIGHHSSTGIA